MSQPGPQLQYGTRDSLAWYQRRITRRLLALLVVLIVLYLIYNHAPTYWRRAKFLRAQDAVASATAANTIYVSTSTTQPAVSDPMLTAAVANYYFWWRASQGMYPTATSGVPLFAHKMVTAGGDDRIVVIHGSITSSPDFLLQAWIFENWATSDAMKGNTHRSYLSAAINSSEIKFHLKPEDSFQVYGGVLDATDPSHVSIPYVLNGQSGTLHALLVDGDKVRGEVAGKLSWDEDVALFHQRLWVGSFYGQRRHAKP